MKTLVVLGAAAAAMSKAHPSVDKAQPSNLEKGRKKSRKA